MLREPGYIDKVSAQLTAEQFVQPQQKELYEAMLRCREQEGIEMSLATLRAFVSEEALNELSRLAAQYSDVNCTPEDIKLYLERIARGTPVASRAASMSTNDIEQYLQSMREQKQGTADAEDSVCSLHRLGPEGEAQMQKMSQTEEMAKMLAGRARRHVLTPEQVSRAMEEQDSTRRGWTELLIRTGDAGRAGGRGRDRAAASGRRADRKARA